MRRLISMPFYLLFLCGLSTPSAFATAPQTTSPEQKSDAYLQTQIEKKHIAALSVAVVKSGKVVFVKGYGKSNLEVGAPATPQTVYEIGSISKQFTAVCIMKLVEEGKIGLDDPISKHYKTAPSAWEKVTVRHLLTHSSGIKDYTDIGDVVKMFREQHTAQELMNLITSLPLNFAPGEKWAYSNTNYYLLGIIVENVSGKSLEDFLRDRVFRPLGMTATCTTNPSAVIPHRASGYGWEKNRFRNLDPLNPTAAGGAGFLASNVLDMAKWARAWEQGSLLKPESVKEILTPVKLSEGKSFPYGFGWMIDTYRGRKHLWHNGGTIAQHSVISRFPEDKLTVIVLCNTAQGEPEPIAKEIAAYYIPAIAAYKEKGAEDKDPKTTLRLKTLLLKMIDATAAPEEFSEAMRKRLFPDVLKQSSAQLKALGSLKTFTLLRFAPASTTKSYEYLVVLGETKLRATFTLDSDDKVSGIMLRPE